MTALPSPRERRTCKIVVYVTPSEHKDLTKLAEIGHMSLSELGAQSMGMMLDANRRLGVIREKPLPPPES